MHKRDNQDNRFDGGGRIMAKPEAFVIMPYEDPYENVYSNIIHIVLKQCGFEPLRADQVQRSTPFSKDIETYIRSADLVIAEVSEKNLNVHYELGIAMALNKEIILISQNVSEAPADIRHIRHLNYNLQDQKSLRDSFKEWVEKSRAYQFKSQKQTAKVLNRGEIFKDITDATFYLSQRRQDDRQDIISRIRNGGLIPPQYLYKFDRGSTLWLDLCQDAEYKYFVSSINFFQDNVDNILDAIGNDIVTNSPDYISLGPGNGAKDKMFISKIIERQRVHNSDFYYYPFDISSTLLSDSIRNVTKSKIISDAIRIKAVECDFSSTLKSFAPVYQYRPETNIFTLLGNTLGNMDQESNFLYKLKEAMFSGDILVVEVRLASDEPANIGGSMDTNKKFDFTPLDILGVEYDEDKLVYTTQPNRSSIPDTRTTIAQYLDFYLPGDDTPLNSALLSYIHEYKPESLRRVMANIGFNTLEEFNEKGLSCYVLQKP
jgi:hypothetical protein